MNLKSLYLRAVLLLALLVMFALVVPSTTLYRVREEVSWLGPFIDRLEALWPAVDMSHVFAFGLLGAALRPALGSGHLRSVALGFAVFAVASEVVQYWVPGRSPRLGDVMVDIGGALAGYATLSVICALGRGLLAASSASPEAQQRQ